MTWVNTPPKFEEEKVEDGEEGDGGEVEAGGEAAGGRHFLHKAYEVVI